MKKRRSILTVFPYFMIVAFAITFTGCATPISRKAEVQAIKKVAVVSLSFNSYIYNFKAGPKSDRDRKILQKKADEMKAYTGKTADTTQASYEQLLYKTSKTYTNALKGIEHWNIIPIEEVIKMPAYQNVEGEPTEVKNYMPMLPYPGSKYFDAFRANVYKEKNRKTYQDLTELCKQLDCDAVIVLRTIVAYEPHGIQFLGGLGGLLASKKSKAKPLVGTALSVVTKDGNSAVFTRAKVEYKGKPVSMMQTGVINFTGDDEAIIQSYTEAIQASADDLVKTINKELAAK